jgi:5-methylcytosine-specific restriction endonuclease McrA
MYERLGTIELNELSTALIAKKSKEKFLGVWCKTNSLRVRVLKNNDYTCQHCGLRGLFAAVERARVQTPHATPYHLNVYGKNADGVDIMLTHDHVIPRAKGGQSTEQNGQALCRPCNQLKADS